MIISMSVRMNRFNAFFYISTEFENIRKQKKGRKKTSRIGLKCVCVCVHMYARLEMRRLREKKNRIIFIRCY